VLGVRRQHVNQVARGLEARGRLARIVDPQTGKIVNTLREPAEPPPPPSLPAALPHAAPTPAAQRVLDALGRLASTRPIFHAEADFQHALAWELRAHDVRRRRGPRRAALGDGAHGGGGRRRTGRRWRRRHLGMWRRIEPVLQGMMVR
jgi:hypothetical protein